MSPSSEHVLATAAAMTASGLQAAGYGYVNLDDGIVEVDRDASGNLVPTAAMGSWKALSDSLHASGFKFGIYTDRGPKVLFALQRAPRTQRLLSESNLLPTPRTAALPLPGL